MLKNLSDDEKQALIHLGDKVYDDAVKPVAKNVSRRPLLLLGLYMR